MTRTTYNRCRLHGNGVIGIRDLYIYIYKSFIHQELVVHTHTHTEKHTKNKLK